METTNQDRTNEYLKIFNREKVIKLLIKKGHPVIFDVGANVGDTLVEFKKWWPNSKIHCFEPQEECWANLDSKISENNYIMSIILEDKGFLSSVYKFNGKYETSGFILNNSLSSK